MGIETEFSGRFAITSTALTEWLEIKEWIDLEKKHKDDFNDHEFFNCDKKHYLYYPMVTRVKEFFIIEYEGVFLKNGGDVFELFCDFISGFTQDSIIGRSDDDCSERSERTIYYINQKKVIK